jgi:hypothetical protein
MFFNNPKRIVVHAINHRYFESGYAFFNIYSGSDSFPASQGDSSFEGSWLFEGDCVQFSALYYLQRIERYSGVSPGCIVAGFHYLEQLKAKATPITLTPRNLQRLLLVAVMTATKFLEDHCPPISCW